MQYKNPIQDVLHQLNDITLIDKQKIRKELHQLNQRKNDLALQDISRINILNQFNEMKDRYQARKAKSSQAIEYPDNLPVTHKKQEIYDLINDHQVVIIAGETGSGKTTQIPKICLELGLGVKGYIGHTQPRRLAARSVANRIAEELNSEIGDIVGYKVRFNDHVSDTTLVKLMTDGVLLAEIHHDKLLLQYDTIIIDEAHERSLNIDFILGYIKQILPKRPDLKVIITSATIDVERFSAHFNQAPIIEVSGRTYPVEVRYRPQAEQIDDNNDDNEAFQSIINAIDELSHEALGDILIFLTGEREIRNVADLLNKLQLPHTHILPLYARLSASEQNQVFKPYTGRRIILATNVAETSLTIPGIKYVIDPGLARISRYSYRTKVQRLPIEPISQASANQRKGRCGRTSNGICIRLYDEQDYLSRPEFTEPEILRTSLASVILQMAALGLGDIASFPFVEAPEQRNINDGVRLLEELGAIYHKQGQYLLTKVGRSIAQLPVDPRLARMLVESRYHACVKELMIITAALSIQDPRERPLEKRQAVDLKHNRFVDKESDFMSFIKLWTYIQEQQKLLSANQFRQLCRKEFLSYLRIQEWQDIYQQIRQTLKQLAFPINSKMGDYRSIHTAILSGLLSHVGMKDNEKFEYIGTRGNKFAVFPNSGLFKSQPKWCIASELVETTKLWGRIIAKIDPEWIEPLAAHLIKKSYNEPHWSKKQGTTMANEKVTLLGLVIIAQRLVNYSHIDPILSRELFIRHALVYGEWNSHYPFLKANRLLIEEVENLEHKSRRQDILADETVLFEFYNKRVDKQVVSVRHFDSWWKTQAKQDPNYLLLTKDILINPESETISLQDYPDHWLIEGIKLPLTYQFDLGNQYDGVSVHIPLHILNQIDETAFQWQVPGFRKELIIQLIKCLPKSIRRNFVPAPNYAEAFLNRVQPYQTKLLTTLENELRKMTGVTIDQNDWLRDQIPNYLLITFIIEDEKGKELCSGKDLSQIKIELKNKVQNSLAKLTQQNNNNELEKTGLITWEFGNLPKVYEKKQHNYTIKAYPTLSDEKSSVSIKLVDSEQEQAAFMLLGLRRLVLLNIPSPIKYLHEKLPNKAKLALYFNPFGNIADIIDDCIACAIDHLIKQNGDIVFNQDEYLQLFEKIRAHINELVFDIANQVEKILTLNFNLNKKLKGRVAMNMALSLADIKNQLSKLIYKGFVAQSGYKHLADIYRYLQAIEKRIEKLYLDPNRDRALLIKVENVEKNYLNLINKRSQYSDKYEEIDQIKWMIEELRVNFFAQQIGTPYSISEKRINQFIEKIITY